MTDIISGLITAIIGIALYVAVMAIFAAWPIQLLWNWLVPTLFGGPIVTFWQAFGLMALSGLLFKSSSSSSSSKSS